MAKRKQRPSLASDPRLVPPGMSAFIDVLESEPKTPPKSRYPEVIFGGFSCDQAYPGCRSKENHAAHPSILVTVADPRTEPWLIHSVLRTRTSLTHDLPLYRAAMENPAISGWALATIVSNLTSGLGRGPRVYTYTEPAEAMLLELLSHPRRDNKVLVEFARCCSFPELALVFMEDKTISDRLKVLMLMNASQAGIYRRDVLDAARHYGGRTPRVAAVLLPLKRWDTPKDDGEVRLLKFSRSSLARFAHCEQAAVEMMETLAPDWNGTPEEFIDMVAMILGKKRERKY